MPVRMIWRAAACAIALAVCGVRAARAEDVTIKVWMHEHPPRLAIDRQIVAEFEKAHPDVKVDYQVIGASEYATKLLTAFAAGSGPDVFNQTVSLVAQYYNARILAPIDYAAMGYANEAALTDQYSSGFQGIRFGGALYGVPTEVSNFACYLNNDMWKEAGLDPAKDFPATWEGLPAVAEKLTKRDANGVPIRRGFDFDWPSGPIYWLTMNTLMHQLGGSLVDEADYKAAYEGPAALHATQFLVDWVNKYKLGGPQYTDTRTDFLGKNLATDCSFGIWGIPQMHDAKINFTVRPLPRFADSNVDEGFDAYAYYMMVNARSSPAQQKAAWAFVRMFTDHAVDLFKGAGLFVPRQDVIPLASEPDSLVFLNELKKAKFAPRVVGYGQVVDVLTRGRDRMVQGGEPVDSVVPAVDKEIDAVLKRERARAQSLLKQ